MWRPSRTISFKKRFVRFVQTLRLQSCLNIVNICTADHDFPRFHGDMHRPNENKMSDGGRERASLGVEVWKSSENMSVPRVAVSSTD
jgi:hypothetical protein